MYALKIQKITRLTRLGCGSFVDINWDTVGKEGRGKGRGDGGKWLLIFNGWQMVTLSLSFPTISVS